MAEWKDMGSEPMELAEGVQERKYYPHLDIDLKKNPELSKDIGEECVFLVKAKIVSKRMDEQSKVQCVEVREIAVPAEEKPKNEADEILESLQKGKRY